MPAVAAATEDAWLEHEVHVRVGEITEELLRDNRFERLVIDSRGHGDGAARSRRNHDGVPIQRDRGAGIRERTQACIAQEGVVVEIAVAVQIAEDRESEWIAPIDHDASAV